ncbi:hypothetical protein AAMO2058_000493800 [Amorphochlora amoebiformis]
MSKIPMTYNLINISSKITQNYMLSGTSVGPNLPSYFCAGPFRNLSRLRNERMRRRQASEEQHEPAPETEAKEDGKAQTNTTNPQTMNPQTTNLTNPQTTNAQTTNPRTRNPRTTNSQTTLQATEPQTTEPQTKNFQTTNPQAVRSTGNEAKLGGLETKSEPEGETKMNRIIVGLREMLYRFTVSENMYVELAAVVERDYPTNRDRVEAVQRILSQWKQAGVLRLRTDTRRGPGTH